MCWSWEPEDGSEALENGRSWALEASEQAAWALAGHRCHPGVDETNMDPEYATGLVEENTARQSGSM